MWRSIRRLAFGLAGLGMAVSTSAGSALAFERIVVLGDSLSDQGNAGRSSNGPVWVEHLAFRLGLSLTPSQSGGSNFAVGGARLDGRSGPNSLRAQADRYLKTARPNGRTLHIVYGGGNDLFAALNAPNPDETVERAVASLKSILADLARQGATDVLVPNLPDIGITPEVRAQGTRAAREARALTEQFNAGLERVLAGMEGSPAVRLHRLNVWAMGERVSADPAGLGFVNVTSGCNGQPSCEGYLFWDRVHPTTRAHGRLAEEAHRVVSQQ
jgi:phospholipase/lecithinase/hemolysin